MNKVWTNILLLLFPLALAAQPAGRQPFNDGWRFRQVPALSPKEAQPDFNDFGWRVVDLPHDWGVEGPGDGVAVSGAPRLNCWGKAWYRKHFNISKKDLSGRVFFTSEGAMSGAEVWVNGVSAGRFPDGYAPFTLDMTDYLREGDNAIAVSLDNKPVVTGDYPGGGLYRPVWLTRSPKACVERTEVRTEVNGRGARVQLRLHLRNAGDPVQARISTRIYPDYEEFLSDAVALSEPLAVTLTDTLSLSQWIELEDIALWTPDEPNRYYAVTTVKTPYGEDRFTTRFGFQGERPALQGVLLPHDLGPLGAVWEDGLWAERLSRLKETGCNAVSTGALPPAPGLLDLCDRMGLLFVDGTAGRRAVTDGTHPCVVDGSGQAAFDLYGYAPVGSFSTENALFNTAGFPTASYAVCRARWNTETPVAEVIAHAPSSDGKTVLVEVRTNGDSGVLYVNGRSQGFRKVDPQRGCLSWNAAYEPGEISVLVYRNGRPWARGKAATVGAPAAVVWAEGIEQRMAGTDMTRAVVLRIPVEVVDADGKRVPDAAPTLEFSLAGFGRILAVDAGDPLSETPFTAQKILAHQGRAAVYIYKKGEEKVILSVRSPGLKCPRMEL